MFCFYFINGCFTLKLYVVVPSRKKNRRLYGADDFGCGGCGRGGCYTDGSKHEL